ncbi:MAG TPA: ATP-dependent zinc metalloprotease FtsH [Acidimicrobiales bacterium]|nr:ATP-dependent zinc metalloprotease FtsH [Acidimicrobiales bacterium]
MSRDPSDLRPRPGQRPPAPGGKPAEPGWRWIIFVVVGLLLLTVVLPLLIHSGGKGLSYAEFQDRVNANQVGTANINNSDGHISGKLRDGTAYSVTGPNPAGGSATSLENSLTSHGVQVSYHTPSSNPILNLLPIILLLAGMVLIYMWLGRRAQGQMTGLMSIGRSRAKVYTTERPKTTFGDVAGYNGVKREITEVVDFLRQPGRFKEIGARIPKGVLLVGPPGTGKTLIARAVAGEAGVPFISVTGSDFMEMFVGVGAARVRDLFQTARKQAPAIIFVDEIDSIGRKRGAGLGGGHDEREQTLNQMLAEMDGFETTEGIVMMAATNRPDILDPALLRPGRFDRQIIVPLPDLEERKPILTVHCKDKRIASDVDLDVLARGTPGMSGADLSNLVNEAALHAVRRGSEWVHMVDFEAARDRVLMGQRRESMALSDAEKERVAYHEAGHAVLAQLLPNADPVHKVTILPTGMALGVTQQLPLEERHIYPREYIEDSLAVRMGGRVAELMIYGTLSTGANNDLVGNTELARKMVCEWGMSDRVGPMAWGSQGQVFLGEDLMHTRDYSDETSRVIDEEVERILRQAEERASEVLRANRSGLEAVAGSLLEKETVDGAEIKQLLEEAAARTAAASGNGSGPRTPDGVADHTTPPAA